jgi:hypothetical protein
MDMSIQDTSAALAIACAACGHPATASAPTVGPEWEPLRALVGTWEGRDEAMKSSGRFTLAPDLDGKVLVRRNTNDTPRGKHEDLMVISRGPAGLRADYWDNEGHVIAYAITTEGSRVKFVSDAVPNAPRFELTYDVRGPDELAIDFAVAPPGGNLQHYTGGVVHRVTR